MIKTKEQMANNKIEITKEMFEECEIPKPMLGITQTFDNGDEYYEDENYIWWNGMCVLKQRNKRTNEII